MKRIARAAILILSLTAGAVVAQLLPELGEESSPPLSPVQGVSFEVATTDGDSAPIGEAPAELPKDAGLHVADPVPTLAPPRPEKAKGDEGVILVDLEVETVEPEETSDTPSP